MIREYITSIKKGEFTAEQGVKKFIDRIKSDKHNAVLEVFSDAIDRAREIDKKFAKGEKMGALAGVPIVIKDNILFTGHIASAGSKMLEKFVAPYNATIVDKMLSQDAIILGRANMDEFAMGTTGESSAYGPTHNGLRMGYVAGGSSSGSSSAVAADLCVASIGTDTGGSIRLPASFNGLVAMKPTYGTVSRYGIIAMASSLDQAGPLCKNVEDTEILLNVIRGKDGFDGTSLDYPKQDTKFDIKNLKIG
ncbi:MAG: Asp-tRNA(Asn)/Glu-tRNA(Gln) amidotransferase subunit GatA, partial [Christensenellaceae bacterium]|nr:Asp-tRNA(Asn)/Glu-tRNA(Gln) amidotransferase subunit GatA [Christensenellaceae bacterium]